MARPDIKHALSGLTIAGELLLAACQPTVRKPVPTRTPIPYHTPTPLPPIEIGDLSRFFTPTPTATATPTPDPEKIMPVHSFDPDPQQQVRLFAANLDDGARTEREQILREADFYLQQQGPGRVHFDSVWQIAIDGRPFNLHSINDQIWARASLEGLLLTDVLANQDEARDYFFGTDAERGYRRIQYLQSRINFRNNSQVAYLSPAELSDLGGVIHQLEQHQRPYPPHWALADQQHQAGDYDFGSETLYYSPDNLVGGLAAYYRQIGGPTYYREFAEAVGNQIDQIDEGQDPDPVIIRRDDHMLTIYRPGESMETIFDQSLAAFWLAREQLYSARDQALADQPTVGAMVATATDEHRHWMGYPAD